MITKRTAEELAGELAAFRVYPPERSIFAGDCCLCGAGFGPGEGRVLLGSGGRGAWAVLTCRPCTARLARLQKLVTCRCGAIVRDEGELRRHCGRLPVAAHGRER